MQILSNYYFLHVITCMFLFLYGPDTYRSRQKVRDIVTGYQKAHANAVHIKDLDCAQLDVEELKNEVESVSLFEKKKLLILRNALHNGSIVEFLESRKKYLKESDRHIVVLWETEESKAKSKNTFYQWLKKHATCQEFLLLTSSNLQRWIQREFARYGVKIMPRSAEQLARAIGGDLWQLSNTVKQIALYKKSEENPTIKEVDIALFVSPKMEADIFATIDAIAQKDKKHALALIYKHLAKGDSPYYLFTMLLYQFRTTLEIKDMLERKVPYQEMLSKSKMHPYVLKKGSAVAERFTIEELKKTYQKLFQLDHSMKTGRIEPNAVFDVFIAAM